MPLYRLKVKREGNLFVYPAPDIEQITGAKYRGDMQECVAFYPETLTDPDATEITQAEYDAYGQLAASADKMRIRGDGTDAATITVALPYAGGQVRLSIDGEVVALEDAASDTVTFSVTADTSLVGRVLKVQAGHDLWKPSETVYIEVI